MFVFKIPSVLLPHVEFSFIVENGSSFEVSHFLLEYPTFDFRGADESGRTVLHKVCGMNASDDVYASSVEILRMLLSREGLDINQQDNSGETPSISRVVLASRTGSDSC